MGFWNLHDGNLVSGLKFPALDYTTTQGISLSGTSSSNKTASAWTQLVASLAEDAYGFWLAEMNGDSQARVDIGIGAAGSELVLLEDAMVFASSTVHRNLPVFYPVRIPRGTRVVARALSNSGTIKLAFGTMRAGWHRSSLYSRGRSLGWANTTTWVPPYSGNSGANTKGAWVQIEASTSFPINALMYQGTHIIRRSFVDVGVGAAGSEVVIAADIPHWWTDYEHQQYPVFPVNIPVGSRIAARAQGDSAYLCYHSLVGFY